MKSFIKYGFAALVVLISSCKKDTTDVSLIGTWQLAEYYISTGGPGEWKKVDKKIDSYLQINKNGTLAGNSYSDYKTYVIKSSSIITFNKTDGTYKDYYYVVTSGKLTLSPAGPTVCIEGCSSRYRKIHS